RWLSNTRSVTPVPHWSRTHPQDAQKGRPARPQQAKGRIVLLRYGEPLSDARTPLADFFRILLVGIASAPLLGGSQNKNFQGGRKSGKVHQ
ncbi:MAG: hypothetical protein WBO50_01865, partial [Nitrospira sp.]